VSRVWCPGCGVPGVVSRVWCPGCEPLLSWGAPVPAPRRGLRGGVSVTPPGSSGERGSAGSSRRQGRRIRTTSRSLPEARRRRASGTVRGVISAGGAGAFEGPRARSWVRGAVGPLPGCVLGALRSDSRVGAAGYDKAVRSLDSHSRGRLVKVVRRNGEIPSRARPRRASRRFPALFANPDSSSDLRELSARAGRSAPGLLPT